MPYHRMLLYRICYMPKVLQKLMNPRTKTDVRMYHNAVPSCGMLSSLLCLVFMKGSIRSPNFTNGLIPQRTCLILISTNE